MSRLEELILFILDRAHKMGINDLSKFQLFKIPYLIQVFSIKYTGIKFIPEAIFLRNQNGPISVDIYSAVEKLEKTGYIKKEIKENRDYKKSRHCHSLAKKLPKLGFTIGEEIFLDNFLLKLLPLTQAKLKELAYNTEPMKNIKKEEEKRGNIKKGAVLDFSAVMVDSDVVDIYSDNNP